MEEAIADLERRSAEAKAADVCARAKKRSTAIARAHGSARASYEDDTARVAESVNSALQAIDRLNDRYEKLLNLEIEVLALADRWGDLEVPELQRPDPPLPWSRSERLSGNSERSDWPRQRASPGSLLTCGPVDRRT